MLPSLHTAASLRGAAASWSSNPAAGGRALPPLLRRCLFTAAERRSPAAARREGGSRGDPQREPRHARYAAGGIFAQLIESLFLGGGGCFCRERVGRVLGPLGGLIAQRRPRDWAACLWLRFNVAGSCGGGDKRDHQLSLLALGTPLHTAGDSAPFPRTNLPTDLDSPPVSSPQPFTTCTTLHHPPSFFHDGSD